MHVSQDNQHTAKLEAKVQVASSMLGKLKATPIGQHIIEVRPRWSFLDDTRVVILKPCSAPWTNNYEVLRCLTRPTPVLSNMLFLTSTYAHTCLHQ